MTTQTYKVKDLHTGEIHNWTLSQVLEEINRDTSEDWTPYDETDWKEGWNTWAEGDVFTMIEPEIKP
jgi:hypothetical protein